MQQMQNNLHSSKKTSTKDEAKWESEKQDLYEQVSRANEVLEEKETLKAQQLKALDDGYKVTV